MQFYAATSTKEDFNEAILEICNNINGLIKEAKINLAFVFASPYHQEHYKTILSRIQKEFLPEFIMGCMGEAIIGNNKEIERQPAITLWLANLPNVSITPFHLKYRESLGKTSLANWPDDIPSSEEDPAFIILADPFSTDVKDLLAYLDKEYPNAPVIGGMASGAFSQGDNQLFYNSEILNDGVVGVALVGSIKIHTVVSQGCRPIGKPFIITKSQKNVIQALGGKTALQCYQEIYSSLNHEEKFLAKMGTHIGMVINEYQEKFDRGDFLARNLIGVDQDSGAIAITDFVRIGQTAQFMIRDAKSAHEDLEQLLTQKKEQIKRTPANGALIFSCNGRGLNLFPEPSHDISCIKKVLGDIPAGGFFAQGEIGPIGGVNFLHGFTASIALFSEP